MNDRGATVRRIEASIPLPPGHVASFFVEGDEPIAVDTGMPDSAADVERSLAKWGHHMEDVDHLLVTHPHPDHTGSVPAFVEAGDPTLYAPASARDRLDRDPDRVGERVRRNLRRGGFEGERLEWAVEAAVESLERAQGLLPLDAVDVWVEPGERFDVGGRSVRAVHTPGHQADHLCYVTDLGDERGLFSGDMALPPLRSALIHDGNDDGYREAVAAFFRSLDRFESLSVDRVYPGHGPVHDALAEYVERDRNSLQGRLDQVDRLVGEGYSTVASVVDAIKGDHDLRYMVPEIMSAVAHLERTDRIEGEVVDGVAYYRPVE